MKKTLLVTAIAMAVSGSALAGSAADGLYGKIRLGVQTTTSPSTVGADELDVNSGKLVFGFKGSSDLGNGMTASYGIEWEHDGADQESTGLHNDKSWVALSGDFGKVIAGENSDMAWWACSGVDFFFRATADACSLGHNTSPANAIQYRGSAGAVNFGAAYVADGSGENPTLLGFQYDGGDFKVGAQLVNAGDLASFGGVAATESGSAIGGTYTMGDIIFGVTVGDNGSAVDSGGVDIGVQLPLGGGTFGIMTSSMDATNADSTDAVYSKSMGGGAYWAVEFNSNDAWVDDRTSLMFGMNF